jgi:type VI secretion system protein ImpC
MRTILGGSGFRTLEASWRGVDFLLRRLDVDGPLTLHLLDASPEELREDLLAGDDLSKPGLHRLLVEKTVGTPGAHPWAAFVVLGSFGPSREDAEALGRLAKVASKAGTAVLAGAEPGLVGCASLAATPDPDDWSAPAGEGAEAWAALRRLPEARFVGLALPRLLLRLPYGKETNAVEAFDFEELSTPPGHEEYLWGSPALATALLLGEAFLEDGWGLRPGSSQEISGLPFALVEEGGEKHAVPCAETLFTVRAMQAVTARGLMPLLTMKGTDTVRLATFQSISEAHAELSGPWG